MINKHNTLNEVIKKHPSLVDVFRVNGFKGLDNEMIMRQIGNIDLETILKRKEIGVDAFIDMLNGHINQGDDIDVTLSEKTHREGNINIVGILPCPVRIPLLEQVNKLPNIDKINYTLKAASEGVDWLQDQIRVTKKETLADIYISAGFGLFFEDTLMKKFRDDNVFEDFYHDIEYNKDFNNDEIQLQDPKGDYSMMAVVPAVFVVNTRLLGDLPMPKTWSDILKPIYEGSISLPVSDFDLFNAILIHLYQEFGEEAIVKLKKSLLKSLHPAQMIKSEKRGRVKPIISIMPYFFTKMALPGSVLKAVWPEDGAIISPIFLLSKRAKKAELKPITDMFMSKQTGEILAHKGLFPSVHKEVDNKLVNNKFKWVGWDYINNNDIGKILNRCVKIFNEGKV